MNIGETLRNLRKGKKIKQQDAAKGLKITQSYLSRIESNDKEPSTDLIKRIGDYYEVPFAVVLWKSIEITDIRMDKQETFSYIKPLVDQLIEQIM